MKRLVAGLGWALLAVACAGAVAAAWSGHADSLERLCLAAIGESP